MQINLFLRVMRRREDGYHDLASLFHVSELCACIVAYRNWFWHRCWERPHPAQSTGMLPAVQVIDLGDTMEFALLPPGAQQDELTCDMEGVPTDERNLVIKASFKFACLKDIMLSKLSGLTVRILILLSDSGTGDNGSAADLAAGAQPVQAADRWAAALPSAPPQGCATWCALRSTCKGMFKLNVAVMKAPTS